MTYAALECRLAIERICYDRLRIAHGYISQDDLKRWQPREIVNILIQEVDPNAASTFTLSISKEPVLGDSSPTAEEYEAMEFLPVGTQVGFNPNKLGKLWNGLAKLALHISIPQSKDDPVARYGDPEKIRSKVSEALEEIKRIDSGTLLSTGLGEEISFSCSCGRTNVRRVGLLREGHVISCINPQCDESYEYQKSSSSFIRRTILIKCRRCGAEECLPLRKLEKLKTDQSIHFDCEGDGCTERIIVQWRPMQTQRTRP